MAAGSYSVTDIVIDFSRANPGARIAIQMSNPRVALETVRSGRSDFAVIILDPSQDVDDLTVRRLWDEPLALCASMDGRPLKDSVNNIELVELDWVTPPSGLVTRDIEDEMLRGHGVTHRNIILELGHPESLKRAVRAGVGVTFLPESTVRDDFAAATLRQIHTPELTDFRIPVHLVHRRRKLFSALQRRVIEHIIASRPKEYL